MLSNVLIGFLDWLSNFVCGMLPDTTNISTTLGNAQGQVSTVVDFVKQVNFIVPLPDIMIILGIDVAIRLVTFGLYLVNFIKNVIVNLIP